MIKIFSSGGCGKKGFNSSSIAPGTYEPFLGYPPVDGYVLSSTISGTRSWVANGSTVSGLANKQILFGAPSGGITQDARFTYDNTTANTALFALKAVSGDTSLQFSVNGIGGATNGSVAIQTLNNSARGGGLTAYGSTSTVTLNGYAMAGQAANTYSSSLAYFVNTTASQGGTFRFVLSVFNQAGLTPFTINKNGVGVFQDSPTNPFEVNNTGTTSKLYVNTSSFLVITNGSDNHSIGPMSSGVFVMTAATTLQLVGGTVQLNSGLNRIVTVSNVGMGVFQNSPTYPFEVNDTVTPSKFFITGGSSLVVNYNGDVHSLGALPSGVWVLSAATTLKLTASSTVQLNNNTSRIVTVNGSGLGIFQNNPTMPFEVQGASGEIFQITAHGVLNLYNGVHSSYLTWTNTGKVELGADQELSLLSPTLINFRNNTAVIASVNAYGIGIGIQAVSLLDLKKSGDSQFFTYYRQTGNDQTMTSILPTDCSFGIIGSLTGTSNSGGTTRLIGVNSSASHYSVDPAISIEGSVRDALAPTYNQACIVLDGSLTSGTGRTSKASGNLVEVRNNGALSAAFYYDLSFRCNTLNSLTASDNLTLSAQGNHIICQDILEIHSAGLLRNNSGDFYITSVSGHLLVCESTTEAYFRTLGSVSTLHLDSEGQIYMQCTGSPGIIVKSTVSNVSVEATTGEIDLNSGAGKYNLTNIASYASNTAAVTGLGGTGFLYRNGDNLCITH